MEVIQQLHWKPPERRFENHLIRLHSPKVVNLITQIKIMSNEIKLYCHGDFYVITTHRLTDKI